MVTTRRTKQEDQEGAPPLLYAGLALAGLGLYLTSRRSNGNGGGNGGGNGTDTPVVVQQPVGTFTINQTSSPIRLFAKAWTNSFRNVEITSQLQWYHQHEGRETPVGPGDLNVPGLEGWSTISFTPNLLGTHALEARLSTGQRGRTLIVVEPGDGGGGGGGGGNGQPTTPVVIQQPRGNLTIPEGSTLRFYARAYEDLPRTVDISSQIRWIYQPGSGSKIDVGGGSMTVPGLEGFSVRDVRFNDAGVFALEATVTNRFGLSAFDRTLVTVEQVGSGSPVIELQPGGEVTIPSGSTIRLFSRAFENASSQTNISNGIRWHMAVGSGAWNDVGLGAVEADLPGWSVRRFTGNGRGRFGFRTTVVNGVGLAAVSSVTTVVVV